MPGQGLLIPAPAAPMLSVEDTDAVRLRDGSRVMLRPPMPADERALREFLGDLCPEARRLRFFSGAADIDIAAHWAVATGPERYGLIAIEEAGAIVGHAIYVQLDIPLGEPARAEVAVEVADRLLAAAWGRS